MSDPDATIAVIAACFAAVAEKACATGLITTRQFALGLTDRVYVWLAHRADRPLTAPCADQWNAAIDEVEVIVQATIDKSGRARS